MAIFKRRASAGKPSVQPASSQTAAPAPELDDLLGDADAHSFRAALGQGQWEQFHDFLEAERDPGTRFFYANGLAHAIEGHPGWLDEWCAARPGSAIPVLFRGLNFTAWAWQARGAGRAHTVKQDAWPLFHERLVAADKDLMRAAELDPADPTPHAGMLWPAIGLSLGQAELRRRFGETDRRDRWHLGAYRAMSQGLAAKWGGSNDSLLAFARTALAEAPDGHPVHVIVPSAHLEVWLYFTHRLKSGTPEHDEARKLQTAYFQRADVKAEVHAAADKSIRSAAYVPFRSTPAHRNVFAMCFALMHDYPAQLEQMRLIGPLVSRIPWQYQGKPAAAYERARARALAAGQAT
ncbi:MAG TPA: hypothetical protein VEL03_08950 [Streptosporangiaceae bacterium]|nr:hypothetical protein [Streptosporangiaceae bacterium]